MGLTGAMTSALSGLRVTQSQMEVVSQNIANVDSVGYTRRQATVLERNAAGRATGAGVAGIQRQLSLLVQKQLRTETAGAAFTDIRARYAEQLDRLFGTPGEAGALDGAVNAFQGSLQQLVANPANSTARAEVLSRAEALAGTLNGLSQDIQRLRTNAETRIADGVERVNTILQNIAGIESKLAGNGQVMITNAPLLDERDRAIQELASLIDIRVITQESGRVNIFTETGVQLFSGRPVTLSFDGRAPLTANSLYSTNPADRGVGTIRVNSANGAGVDIIAGGLFRSGEIAAEIDMRDNVLVEAQAQIDGLAAALAGSLGDRSPVTPYTTGVNAGFDIELDEPATVGQLAMKAGNSLSIEVNTPTGPRRIQIIATDGAAPNPIPADLGEGGAQIVRYDRATGFAGLQAAVARS
jgi:flagellar hook-associated protein 1